jgi:hypothetical protein
MALDTVNAGRRPRPAPGQTVGGVEVGRGADGLLVVAAAAATVVGGYYRRVLRLIALLGGLNRAPGQPHGEPVGSQHASRLASCFSEVPQPTSNVPPARQ